MPVTATYIGPDQGSGLGLSQDLRLVGDNSVIYLPAGLTGVSSLTDGPQVSSGGTITGYEYFLVSAADTNFLLIADDVGHKKFIDVTP